jgi:exopolysaccharide biosynthesis polyprenyl glycosylphosphotransferase
LNSYEKISEFFIKHTPFDDKKSSSNTIYIYFKQIVDMMFAIIGFFLFFPIILVFGVAIKIETSGPMFYYQERVGLNGKLFTIIKLRSMGVDAEKSGAQWAVRNDPRVTKIGHFIRTTRIDELPQLINIIKGDMSLIGPRPERLIFTEKFNQDIPGFVNRLAVKPGLTGWAQVNGGYEITPKEKLELDMQYIENLNMLTDLKIIIKTVKVVFTGDGAR